MTFNWSWKEIRIWGLIVYEMTYKVFACVSAYLLTPCQIRFKGPIGLIFVLFLSLTQLTLVGKREMCNYQ